MIRVPSQYFIKRMHKKQKIFVPRSSSPARSTLSSHFQNISPPKSPSPTPYIPSPSPSSGVFGVIAGLGAILLLIGHLVLIDVYQVAISDRDLCTLDDLGTVISSYLSREVGIPTLKSLIHRLVKFVWAIFNLALVLVGIGTLYFLGYIRLKTPESAEASADSSSASASSSASSSNSPSGGEGTVIHHPHLWLYECQHDQSAYLCFPPYCAPGGLRSLLFPSYPAIDTTGKSIERAILISDIDSTTCDNLATNSKGTSTEEDEEEEEAEDEFAKPSKNNSPDKLHLSSNSINNPIDIFLQTAQHHHHFQLPHIIRSTLGGSKCSFKRHLLATEKKRELDSKRKESELEKETLDSEEIETWKESSTPDSKKGRECELVPSTQYQQKEEESAAFIENTDSTEHSFWGLGAATKHLVHQAVSYSYPLLERAVDNIVHFEEILPLTSELDSPQKLDNQEQPTHQQKKTKAIPNIQSLSHLLLAEDNHYNHYTHSNISSIMPPAQQNTIPSPPSSANVPIHAQPAMNTANINDNDYTNNPAGKPIPQAVLVYHESAHSIVFRDHLRRQQSAIRRTSTQMENNSVHGHRATIAHPPQRKNVSKSPAPRHRATTMSATTSVNNTPAASRSNTPAVSRDVSTDGSDTDANDVILVSGTATTESDMGYESGGSRGSTRSNRSGGDGSSVSSVGSGVYKKNMNGVPLVKNHVNEKHHHQHKPPPPSMHPVVIANFQPVIEPLDHLDLNSSHVFEPLLDADPWAEKSEGEDMLKMTEAEREGAFGQFCVYCWNEFEDR